MFISLPGDILNAEAGIELGRSTRVDTRVKPSDEALQALVQRILKAERPVIITGMKSSRATHCRRRLTGARSVVRPSVVDALWRKFPVGKPVLHGRAVAFAEAGARGLSPYDLMIVLADPLRMSVYSEVDPLPDGCRSCRSV